jgi:hypothetical protein
MPKKQKVAIPLLKVRKGATLREIYKRAHEEFSAADLQRFTEIEPMVPAEQVLAELEEIHRKVTQKPKKRGKKGFSVNYGES